RQTVNQATACVRTAHTLHVDFEVPCNSQVGCVAQPRTRCWVCRLRLAAAETPEEKAKDAAEEAKEEAKDAAEEAKEEAKDAAEEAKEEAKDAAEDAKEAAEDAKEEAK
ncbi:TPA: hypothetical protein ACJKG9_001456, partial [Neisseria meningitidis]